MATQKKTVEDVVASCETMTILSRLELARNLICNRMGEPGYRDFDPTLAIAEGIVSNVMLVLETYPDSGELRLHHPNAKQDGVAFKTPALTWPVLQP